MQHSIQYIAQTQWLPRDELLTFAAQNMNKYGVYEEDGQLFTSTWWVNDLLTDFRNANTQLCDEHRAQEIAKLQHEHAMMRSGLVPRDNAATFARKVPTVELGDEVTALYRDGYAKGIVINVTLEQVRIRVLAEASENQVYYKVDTHEVNVVPEYCEKVKG